MKGKTVELCLREAKSVVIGQDYQRNFVCDSDGNCQRNSPLVTIATTWSSVRELFNEGKMNHWEGCLLVLSSSIPEHCYFCLLIDSLDTYRHQSNQESLRVLLLWKTCLHFLRKKKNLLYLFATERKCAIQSLCGFNLRRAKLLQKVSAAALPTLPRLSVQLECK